MKKRIILWVFLPIFMQAQNFDEVNSDLKNYYYSASDIGDFNGDGFLDVVHNGAIDSDEDGNVDTTLNEIYLNQQGNLIYDSDFGINSTHLGDIRFIDFDNDGLLDIVSTGLSYNDVVNYQQYRFKNTGEGFELIDNLTGKIYGNTEILDFNHDGKLDYILNGTEYIEGIGFVNELDYYENSGDSFNKTQAWLSGTQNGTVKVLDLNNDQLLDVVMTGYDIEIEPIFHVYLNNNGVLELSESLDPIADGDIAYADFNGDGFLDLVVSGQDINYNSYLAVYLNEGDGTFSVHTIDGEGLVSSSIDVGDLNNDGYYDFIIMGDDDDYNGWTNIFYLVHRIIHLQKHLKQDYGI